MKDKISVRVEMDASERKEYDALCAAHGLTLSDAVRRSLRAFFFTLQLAHEPRTPTGRPAHKTRREDGAA